MVSFHLRQKTGGNDGAPGLRERSCDISPADTRSPRDKEKHSVYFCGVLLRHAALLADQLPLHKAYHFPPCSPISPLSPLFSATIAVIRRRSSTSNFNTPLVFSSRLGLLLCLFLYASLHLPVPPPLRALLCPSN